MRNLPLDDLLRGSRWWTISICIEEVLKHIKSWTLCVYFVCERVCVCLILCNTWIGPKVDVGEHAGPCPTLLAWFGETVSRPIKIVTALFHKAWHVYMWFRITDRFQLVSVRTKEAGSNLAFGTQKEYQSLFLQKAWIYWLYYKPLSPQSLSFIFFPCDYYSSVTCWSVCNEIQMEKVLAPGPEPPCSLSPLGGIEPEIKGKRRMGRDRLINRWTRRQRDTAINR